MKRVFDVLTVFLVVAFVAACKSDEKKEDGTSTGSDSITLNGAGATFPYPLYSKWMTEYNRQHPKVRINYQSIGSGGGIRQIVSGTVDFGATDAPMKDDEAKGAPGKIVHVPTTIGAVAVTFNVEGVKELKLTGESLADIYLGKIKKWNDPALSALNEGASLPDQNISVVGRSDGSGTTAIFTDYLSKVSPEFKEQVGVGKSVRWPAGLGAKGNEGVTGQVKTTPGAIGYVELAYALQNSMPIAALRNPAGKFVKPEISAITAAAGGVDMGESLHASITNASGEAAYPISAFTYILVYEDMKNGQKGEALARFLWWATHEGQALAAPLHYAPLPKELIPKIESRLQGLTGQGRKLLEEPS